MAFPLSEQNQFHFYHTSSTGATGTLQTTVFDMTGWESLTLLAYHNTTDADTSSKIFFQVGSSSGTLSDTTGMVNLTKTGLYAEVFRPIARYVQGNFKATASGKTKTIVAVLSGARVLPATQPASTTGKVFYSPGTGTASG